MDFPQFLFAAICSSNREGENLILDDRVNCVYAAHRGALQAKPCANLKHPVFVVGMIKFRSRTATSLSMTSVNLLFLFINLQEADEGGNDMFEFGVCAMQGWRTDMVRTHLRLI
jgi:hypothetical protein